MGVAVTVAVAVTVEAGAGVAVTVAVTVGAGAGVAVTVAVTVGAGVGAGARQASIRGKTNTRITALVSVGRINFFFNLDLHSRISPDRLNADRPDD